MTDEDRQRLAAEAARIRENEAFQAALSAMRDDALKGLVNAPADDANTIRDHQAKVRVVDELRSSLEMFVRNGEAKRKPGIA